MRRTIGMALLAAVMLPTTACSESVATSKEVRYFDSVEEMASSSDLVVRGRVVSVRQGRVAGESAADRVHFRNATIDVAETAIGDPAERLVIEEEVSGPTRAIVGDVAWYFLRRSEGRLRLVCSYGRFGVAGSALGPSGEDPGTEGPWAEHDDVDTAAEISELIARLPNTPSTDTHAHRTS